VWNVARTRVAVCAATGATLACLATGASAAAAATISTNHGCYRVGQKVHVAGQGFMSSAEYNLVVDGVSFGTALTSSTGTFDVAIAPGGLGAGQPQLVDRLEARDGVSDAATTFTITRPTGALIGAGSGNSPQRKVPFEVWDFGQATEVFVHYLHGSHLARTVALGLTGGQCGYLRTAPKPFFPFKPGAGTWTLQFDTSRAYVKHPGRIARVSATVG
jgi:hypothetical protein